MTRIPSHGGMEGENRSKKKKGVPDPPRGEKKKRNFGGRAKSRDGNGGRD